MLHTGCLPLGYSGGHRVCISGHHPVNMDRPRSISNIGGRSLARSLRGRRQAWFVLLNCHIPKAALICDLFGHDDVHNLNDLNLTSLCHQRDAAVTTASMIAISHVAIDHDSSIRNQGNYGVGRRSTVDKEAGSSDVRHSACSIARTHFKSLSFITSSERLVPGKP